MKRKIFTRALLGAPVGLMISYIVLVVISLSSGNGEYIPAAPELISDCNSEISAVIVQMICSLLYGSIWGGASAIWENENWSFFKKTVVHLLVCCGTSFPIALVLHWIPLYDVTATVIYFSGFFGTYFVIWITYYLAMKANARKMNNKIAERRNNM